MSQIVNSQHSAEAPRLATLEIRWWREHHAKRWEELTEAVTQFFSALFAITLDQSRSACTSFLRAVKSHDMKTWGGQPDLVEFYAAVKRASGRKFDVLAAARLEETWWRLHDESVDVLQDLALQTTLAELCQCLFGVPRKAADQIAVWRIQAIHSHDLAEASSSSQEAENYWREAQSCLQASYEVLVKF
jgi:hypothetical protein